jgi:hypothetical protein
LIRQISRDLTAVQTHWQGPLLRIQYSGKIMPQYNYARDRGTFTTPKLKLLPASQYKDVNQYDPIGIPLFLEKGNVEQMPYQDNFFDTVLMISILGHLKADELKRAYVEVGRVLKPGGQMVHGTPVEKPFMVFIFRVMGTTSVRNIFRPKRRSLRPPTRHSRAVT